ncbi:MAG: S1 RNA-binding domain-containing protein [Candidatus Odinarchaeota archaeon]
MVRSKTPFPKEGEFVNGRVKHIEQQYVYLDLLEYAGLPSEEYARGMIHISEISSRWIKNIRKFVRVGQVVVVRVLRVDPSKGHIDCSLRRVNSAQRAKKKKEFKYKVKFDNLLHILTEMDGVNLNLDEAYEKIGWPVLDQYHDFQEAVEALKENGKEIMKNLTDVPESTKSAFLKIVDENVEISTVNIIGKIKLMNTDGDGVDKIKNTLLEVKNIIQNPKDTRMLNLSYIGAPFYRLEIISKDYLDAENILSDAIEILEESAKNTNNLFEFIRD